MSAFLPTLEPIPPCGPDDALILDVVKRLGVRWWRCQDCGEGRILVDARIAEEKAQALAHQDECDKARQ